MSEEADYRLPRTVVPSRYDLILEPRFETFTFDGSVAIAVTVTTATRAVVLNAVDLEIHDARLVSPAGVEVAAHRVDYLRASERAAVRFDEPVPAGEWQLRMRFTGTLNDRLHGFYRSTYPDAGGRERVLATTQFEATDARRAFPCWDEPDLKAVFGVTLVVPRGMIGVSSGPAVSEDLLDDGRRRVRFGDTIRMSTYLLAFIVGDLEVSETVDVEGTALRVLHTPGKSDLTAFALEAGAFALRFFADYYDIPYPGDKLDLVAIPDFASGAMENLGAITFRETLLLIDPSLANHAELQRVVAVIAHEIAHMWFGDLVTMRWWNGTWLKEAFATFMEMKCTDAYRPAWHTWVAFGPTRDEAMEIDALATTRSIEYPVRSPADANAMFDTITYEKGSAVLRMFEQYLGEDVFRRGIARYLQRHAFGNTETSDLWDALEEASGEPVAEIADNWIFGEGFPQVLVESNEGRTHLRQGRFRYLGDADGHWKVPVLYRIGDEWRRVLVDEPVTAEPDEAIIVNAGASGFYRTWYDASLRAGVVDSWRSLMPAERFNVIADMWAHLLAGDVASSAFLELLNGMGDEREPAVWQAALGGLDELNRIAASGDRERLERLTVRVLRGPAAALGWQPRPDEGDNVRRLRGLILHALGTLGRDEATVDDATATLEQWFTDPARIDGDVAAASLMIVAESGGKAEYERFAAARLAASRPQDAVRLLRAAASIPDRNTALELLEDVLAGRVRRQDAYWVVARLIGQREIGATVWNAVRARWGEVIDAMPPQNARLMLDRIHFRSEPDVADDIIAWLIANPIEGSEQLVAQQVERLQIRVGLRQRERPRLGAALAGVE